jgi:hypothetical protein
MGKFGILLQNSNKFMWLIGFDKELCQLILGEV